MFASRAPYSGKLNINRYHTAVVTLFCLFLGLLLSAGAVGAGPQAGYQDGTASPPPGGAASPHGALSAEILSVYRTQRPDGSLDFRGPLAFFENYPLLAALTLDVHRRQADPAFLSQSAAAVSRYYGYLFGNKDQDANFLIETTIASPGGPDFTNVEEVGYNALLSLDMIALARCYLELRKPLRALYWYEGARTQQDRLVGACFDVETNYFFPRDPTTATRIKNFYALSALPALFLDNVGDNHVSSMINNYLLNSANFFPESPSFFLYRAQATAGGPEFPAPNPASLLKTALLSRILLAGGYDGLSEAAVRNALELAGSGKTSGTAHGGWCAPCGDYLVYMMENGEFRRWYAKTDALAIFEELVRQQRRIDDNEIVRLGQNVKTVASLLESGSPVNAVDAVNRLREVYQIVSRTREQIAANQFFSREEAYETPGLEPNLATSNLLDDVTSELHAAENVLFTLLNEDTGLRVSATLMNERPVAGQRIEMKWTLETRTAPVEIRAARIITTQEADQLVDPGSSVVVKPGEPLVFTHSFPARFDRANRLEPINKTLEIEDGRGRRMSYNALRSIYGEQAVQVIAQFPQGRLLRDSPVPIDIRIVKRTRSRVELEGGWHSPAGLRLNEGNTFQYSMAAEQDTVQLRVNVLVPRPCRPGSFPFRFKFFGNGSDLGTISSSLFRPYQWLFIGPFENAQNSLSIQYPPEKSVELQKVYTGIGRRVAWQVLPDDACNSAGAVLFRGALTPPGIGYLYTAIESQAKKPCPLFLGANVPAAVFLNGSLVLTHRPSNTMQPSAVDVMINQGLNTILVKVLGDQKSHVYFKLGDDENMSPDEFNNNLIELVGGYGDFYEKSRQRLADDGDVQKLVTLRYENPDANTVAVIGTFNGWSPEHSRMQKTLEGTWEITLSLRPGKYSYRFLINSRQQVLDPKGAFEEPDGYGGKNSVIFVNK